MDKGDAKLEELRQWIQQEIYGENNADRVDVANRICVKIRTMFGKESKKAPPPVAIAATDRLWIQAIFASCDRHSLDYANEVHAACAYVNNCRKS